MYVLNRFYLKTWSVKRTSVDTYHLLIFLYSVFFAIKLDKLNELFYSHLRYWNYNQT